MTSKSSTAILQARKQCICQESLHAAFCNVQQLARCSICTSCTCSDMSAFYQLHSSRFQYMRDMGRCYAPRCNLYKDSKCVVMCVCFFFQAFKHSSFVELFQKLPAACWQHHGGLGTKLGSRQPSCPSVTLRASLPWPALPMSARLPHHAFCGSYKAVDCPDSCCLLSMAATRLAWLLS